METSNRYRTYSELRRLTTFKERFDYLKLDGQVGYETFGCDRIFNQMFYASKEWKLIRRDIILRDLGCDLGIEGHEIIGNDMKPITSRATSKKNLSFPGVVIHHINPITMKDIEDRSPFLLDPENLITTTYDTHRAIHYGDFNQVLDTPTERSLNDTCPWRKSG